jgi:hypothetical protein
MTWKKSYCVDISDDVKCLSKPERTGQVPSYFFTEAGPEVPIVSIPQYYRESLSSCLIRKRSGIPLHQEYALQFYGIIWKALAKFSLRDINY